MTGYQWYELAVLIAAALVFAFGLYIRDTLTGFIYYACQFVLVFIFCSMLFSLLMVG